MSHNNFKETVTAYPLTWPAGWPRTDRFQIKKSRYGDHTLAEARSEISKQVRLLGGKDLIISSNVELRTDGLPRSGRKQPNDRGAAIYFEWKGEPAAFGCDSWTSVEDNFWAINQMLEGMRQIERAGVSELLKRAFVGFKALPAPKGSAWWEVLEVDPKADPETVKAAYREKVKQHHPDAGGSAEEFQRVVNAWAEAQGLLRR